MTAIKVINADQVVVTTSSGKRFTAGRLIVTAGAWAKELLLQLHVMLYLYLLLYVFAFLLLLLAGPSPLRN